MACIAGPAPRKGMKSSVVRVACCITMPLSFAAAVCSTSVALPGFALIQATSPFRSPAGKSLRAIISCGLMDISPIGSKSFCRS